MHLISPFQRHEKIRTVDDPFFGEDIPKRDNDPFDVLLKPLLERDSKQCDAWKDEVQNILVFAGLFSAVITAFIVESYQKLQPDPNDQIIMLLSRISDQLTTSPNATIAPLIPSASPPFTPSRSDVRINIFWFISLVLSLTVALIGIVTLQWLREHQRYDSDMEPSIKFATFNARSEGLQRWYVPRIFAGLPLLLQCALVLFFVGLVDFLFAIRIQVVIPVTASLGIPILFLVTTTLLPTLQLYTMEFPHLLSVNYNVPAPCSYKSPQSLIIRRAVVLSEVLFRLCAYVFAAIYAPLVGIIRMFNAASKKPFYGKSAPFHRPIDSGFELVARNLRRRRSPGDWMSIDKEWLKARTGYAIVLCTPDTFRGAHQHTHRLAFGSLNGDTGFYDCVQGISSGKGNKLNDVLHHCREALVEKQCSHWEWLVPQIGGNPEYQISTMRGRLMAFMAVLAPGSLPPSNYLYARPGEILPDSKVLRNAYHAALMNLTQVYGMEPAGRKTSQRWIELHMRFVIPYLLKSTQQVFQKHLESHCPDWMYAMSKQWTSILSKIIVKSIQISYSASPAPHICLSAPSCSVDAKYLQVQNLTKYILLFQVHEDIKRILLQLQYCITLPSDPVKDMPYVLVVACAYINAAAAVGYHSKEFDILLQTLSSSCGNQPITFRDTIEPGGRKWDGLEAAITFIHNSQAQTQRGTLSNIPQPRLYPTISYPPTMRRPIVTP
ncbi:hypothetical protein D9619_004599 [Psilocybe cf. subviscida]|uniref:DUF6535 domain-containing protein n=1 Tax=Psilocybe cf. subviscida TaxID=2480587 RepID=A0A8H5BRR5_9AGAR|nr:hypothetical protein D9619_004599 [Psilocybe cf. subviscida]